ncbi:MAG: hypothetical protein DRP91_06620 [Candidatus Neomarinimicrobiota bacterium]|nr:MAG: hypothetical protein DRP91_06620 [Candidatus Neomarinimicrobiota bacterium]
MPEQVLKIRARINKLTCFHLILLYLFPSILYPDITPDTIQNQAFNIWSNRGYFFTLTLNLARA